MSRPKRGSKVLDRAQRRIAALKSISPTFYENKESQIKNFAISLKYSAKTLVTENQYSVLTLIIDK